MRDVNFELGKEYIVRVDEKGIIPIEEFDRERYFDKDNDDIEFLTDEEKDIIINEVLNDMKLYFIDKYPKNYAGEVELKGNSCIFSLNDILNTINIFIRI